MKLRLGTRASDLAIAQSRRIAARLHALGHSVEMVPVRTDGDMDQVRPFAELGTAGLFVRALEIALLEERIDLAVHSYKDLPALAPAELTIAAMPERLDVRDRLLVRAEAVDESVPGLLPLRNGAVVGTAAARRTALLKELRPDLEVKLLRGNVPTRLEKLGQGQYDAILLATAGLLRLDDAARLGQIDGLDRSAWFELDLDPERFVPAPSQGALALQVRSQDERALHAIAPLDREQDHLALRAERELLRLVEAGCQVPFGAWCSMREENLHLTAFLEHEGSPRRATATGTDPMLVAKEAFTRLMGGTETQ